MTRDRWQWIVFAGLVAVACESGPPEVNESLLVSTSWLAEHLDDPDVVIIHVGRDWGEYRRGHIPGAGFLHLPQTERTDVGIPRLLAEPEVLRGLFERFGVRDGSRVVFYDAAGGVLAARGFLALETVGHTGGALLDGGLDAWLEEERDVSNTASMAPLVSLTMDPRPDLLVDADWVHARADDRRYVLVDARSPAEYRGEVAGDDVARAGHIPGAVNVFWRSALVSETRPVFRSPDELRAMFEDAGVDRRTTVVAYCRTGVQASHIYFLARYLGYDAVVYDGSFVEWSHRHDLPVERPAAAG